MVNSASFLSHITSTCSRTVRLPNGVNVPITHVRDVRLTPNITLRNVLCVPSFHFNLISVAKLTYDAKCLITFLPDSFHIQDQSSKKMIGVGRLHDGPYLLQLPTILPKCSQVMSSLIYNLWQQRLGYPRHTRFKLFSHYISDLNTFVDNKPCEICPLAKQTRFPFPLSNRNSIAPFDLIHCDIWGNFHTASLSGAHYFLTIVIPRCRSS